MNTKYLTPISIVIGAIIIGGVLFYTRSGTYIGTGGVQQIPGTTNPAAGPQPSVDIKDVTTAGEPYIGNVNAPVTIAYWSDYQCPYCKQFEVTELPDLIKNYVNTGKLKLVFKDFQFLGPDSTTDSLFARAVWNLYPSQYFAWRTAMFNAQDSENTGFGDEASVITLTKKIPGIDTDKVVAAVNQNTTTYQSVIDADKAEGNKFGVQGTPAFIIGTQLIPGSIAYSSFAQMIDVQLK